MKQNKSVVYIAAVDQFRQEEQNEKRIIHQKKPKS